MLRRGLVRQCWRVTGVTCNSCGSERSVSTSGWTQSLSYHPKVKALPFVLSPQEAISRIKPPKYFDSLVKFHNLRRMWNAFVGRPKKESWTKPGYFTPKEVTAIYLPSWFVDCRMSFSDRPEDSGIPPITAIQAFLPGHTVDPLCRLSMRKIWSRELMSQAKPFSNDMTRQHDMDVSCLPYTLTPFAFDGAAQNLAKLPVKDYVVAAYPVLVPVYLAKYSTYLGDDIIETFAVIEAAHKETKAVYVRNIHERLTQLLVQQYPLVRQYLEKNPEVLALSEFDVKPCDASEFIFPPKADGPLRALYIHINRMLYVSQKQALRKYAEYESKSRSGANIDFSDQRIRPWTENETIPMGGYLLARMASSVLSNMSDVDSVELLRQSKENEARRKPQWLLQWEKQNVPIQFQTVERTKKP